MFCDAHNAWPKGLEVVGSAIIEAPDGDTVAQDAELNRIYTRYLRDRQSLTPEEEDRISWQLNNIMGSYENAYYAWRLDIIGDTEWQRFRDAACLHRIGQGRGSQDSLFLSDSFETYMGDTGVDPD